MGELDPEKSTAALILKRSITNIICFGVVHLVNTYKETPTYWAELMGALAVKLFTHMISKIWIVLEGCVQLILDNMKEGVTIIKKLVKKALK